MVDTIARAMAQSAIDLAKSGNGGTGEDTEGASGPSGNLAELAESGIISPLTTENNMIITDEEGRLINFG